MSWASPLCAEYEGGGIERRHLLLNGYAGRSCSLYDFSSRRLSCRAIGVASDAL